MNLCKSGGSANSRKEERTEARKTAPTTVSIFWGSNHAGRNRYMTKSLGNCRCIDLLFVQMALQTEKNICELVLPFITDTDTADNCFGVNFSLQMQTQLFFAA